MSLAPDTEIENRRVRAPLPSQARLTTVPVEFAPDSAVAQIESQLEKKVEEEVRSERSSEDQEPSRNKTTGAKRGRKKKTELKSGDAEIVSKEPDTSRTGPSPDDKYCPDSKVFARYCIDH